MSGRVREGGLYLGRGIGLTEDAFEDLSRWLVHLEKTVYIHAKQRKAG